MARNLRNIYIEEKGQGLKYTPASVGRGGGNYPIRKSRISHGEFIQEQFNAAWERAEREYADRTVVSATGREGVYLEIRGKEGYDLLTKSLEDVRQKVRLLNVRTEETGTVCATVFVPNAKKSFFLDKVNKYKETEKEAQVIGTIESINNAFVEALWVGNKNSIPTDEAVWCEVWLRCGVEENPDTIVEDFFNICGENGIPHKEQRIVFPERVVVGIYVNTSHLSLLLLASPRIAEIRKMQSPVSFFVDLHASEQREWIQEFVNRIDLSGQSDTSVCILDTGVNNGHPLLSSVLSDNDMHTVEPERGKDDRDGHGTNIAGIAAYFNLEKLLDGSDTINIHHFLESVKIMNKPTDNDKELYGDITARAINLAEIEKPNTNRSICMAITSDSDLLKDGRPTSWSGALDSIISGATEKNISRLMYVSAGNTEIGEIAEAGDFEVAVMNHSVEDPGQAWNAITVGAYTEKISIDDPLYEGFSPLANCGDFSPFTSSSITWDKKWPIKPDIVLEGGNLAFHEQEGLSEAADFQLLTTNRNFLLGKPLDTISMTSSATAQAAWMSAQIQHYYPDLWPETIRALMIHSADWTPAMKKRILRKDKPTKNDYRNLLRICGYGVPSLEKAVWSASNSVNLIIEDELQPFIKKQTGITSNEMHIHELPWPNDLLLDLGNIPVRMRVTLSYFIEPGPGEIGWKDKYRYPSCGLLFDVNNPTENREDFLKRISKAMREDENDKGDVKNDSSRWTLGVNNRNVGSIHSDIWEGDAGQLSQSNLIIIYPIGGWWKTRTNLRKYHTKIRYSLVVTVETPRNETDLYTAIATKVKNKVMIKTEISAL
ncbi:S8 family peptidase [Desulfitobacterium sp. THU1]|uniref:S8 family peptidase n=1 Tax=Desulfitobacterium sp. THU1 TaxID=3138072 RepID=UPI00311D9C0B